jgi:hypothetical protein
LDFVCAVSISYLFPSCEYAAYSKCCSIDSLFSNQQAILFYPLIQHSEFLQADWRRRRIVGLIEM